VPIALLKPFELYKPIIAAVNGYALAGGCEILQATDLRIASRTASFGLSEAQARARARRRIDGAARAQVPHCKAMEILLLGDRMPAEEAQPASVS
jgi:enoyl-CoA hydratase/carnithine racemase